MIVVVSNTSYGICPLSPNSIRETDRIIVKLRIAT
jgi:hypothetical protein